MSSQKLYSSQSKVELDNDIMLDSILDKKLVKFDNKHQMSMFFIAYKSIDALYKELSDSEDIKIPDELIKRIVLKTIPSLIKDYNSNLRKRCRANLNNSNIVNQGASVVSVADDTICLGRKIDGAQCTRKKYNNNDFCKNHIKKLPNGRIDTLPIDKSKSKSVSESETSVKEITDKIKQTTDETNTAPIVVMNEMNNDTKESLEKSNSKEQPKDSGLQLPIKSSKRGRKSKIQFDPRQYDNEYVTLWEDIVEGEKVLIDNANNIYTFDLEHPVYIGKKDVTKKLNIKQLIDSLAKAK